MNQWYLWSSLKVMTIHGTEDTWLTWLLAVASLISTHYKYCCVLCNFPDYGEEKILLKLPWNPTTELRFTTIYLLSCLINSHKFWLTYFRTTFFSLGNKQYTYNAFNFESSISINILTSHYPLVVQAATARRATAGATTRATRAASPPTRTTTRPNTTRTTRPIPTTNLSVSIKLWLKAVIIFTNFCKIHYISFILTIIYYVLT